jgi:hypothetical protein
MTSAADFVFPPAVLTYLRQHGHDDDSLHKYQERVPHDLAGNRGATIIRSPKGRGTIRTPRPTAAR